MSTDTTALIAEARRTYSDLMFSLNGVRQTRRPSVFAAPLLRELVAAGVKGLPLYGDRFHWREQTADLLHENGIRTEIRHERQAYSTEPKPFLVLADRVELN